MSVGVKLNVIESQLIDTSSLIFNSPYPHAAAHSNLKTWTRLSTVTLFRVRRVLWALTMSGELDGAYNRAKLRGTRLLHG
jgi:hypothetical protein